MTPQQPRVERDRTREDEGQVVLSRSTLVPVSVVAGVVATVLMGYVYLDDIADDLSALKTQTEQQATALKTQATTLNAMASKLDQMDRDAEMRTANRWTSHGMHRWARDLARRNPEIDVPDVYEYHPPDWPSATGGMLLGGAPQALPD